MTVLELLDRLEELSNPDIPDRVVVPLLAWIQAEKTRQASEDLDGE